MAETINTDVVIYDRQVQTAYLERIQDVLEVFGANSNGSMLFSSEMIEGNLDMNAFYKIGGSIAHRNVNSTAGVTPTNIDMDERVYVKVPWKYGPFAITEESFKRRARSPEEFSQLMGIDMADAVLEGWVEYAIAAVQAGISTNSAMVVNDVSLATHGKKVLTAGLRTLGDRFGRLAAWVMDSQMYLDIVDQAIDNKIFEEAGLVVYGGQPGTMGKPVLVTDKAPSGKILGLQPGAVRVKESQPPGQRIFDIDDKENLATGFRAEGTFNLELLGYRWANKEVINPNLATVGTPASWEKYATSNKVTAGFIIDLSGASS